MECVLFGATEIVRSERTFVLDRIVPVSDPDVSRPSDSTGAGKCRARRASSVRRLADSSTSCSSSLRLRPSPYSVFLHESCRYPGELGAEARRSHRHRGARRGAASVVQLGEVGGQGHIVELAGVEPGVEPSERPGVGPPGVRADGGLDQPARGRRWPLDRGLLGVDPGGPIIHVKGTGRRGHAAQNIAHFITHRLPSPDIRTATIGVRRGAAVAGGKYARRAFDRDGRAGRRGDTRRCRRNARFSPN